MLVRFLLAALVAFVMAACSDSPKSLHNKQSALQAPTLPTEPIVLATSTVGTLPHSSGASAAGEYQTEVLLDVPAGRAGMAPALSLSYSSGAGRDNVGLGWALTGATSFIRYCAPTFASQGYAWFPNSFCLDQQLLVSVGDHEWRTENESFAKIVVTSFDENGVLSNGRSGPKRAAFAHMKR